MPLSPDEILDLKLGLQSQSDSNAFEQANIDFVLI